MQPAIRARGLTRRFGAVTAVDGIDFAIHFVSRYREERAAQSSLPTAPIAADELPEGIQPDDSGWVRTTSVTSPVAGSVTNS